MNENKLKVYIGNKKKTKDNLNYAMQSYFIKPCGKFWKRYFNKKVKNIKEVIGGSGLKSLFRININN